MQDKNANTYLKKETVLMIALVCLVIGFLGGIVFSVYKSPGGAPAPPPQQTATQQPPAESAEKLQKMLALEREVATNPGNADAWTQLGHEYFDTDQFQKAINAYTKALAIRPGNPNVLTDLGVMYRRNGQPDKALESFDQAIKADPSHEQSRFNKGVVLMFDMNDRDGAIRVWEELLVVNPAAAAPTGQPLSQVIADMKAQKDQ